MIHDALTDRERFPLIDADGRAWLDALRQHARAPRWNMKCGDRLTAQGLERVRAYERALFGGRAAWRESQEPAWVGELAARCLRDVPFYRKHGVVPVDRDDIRREPWSFVPDGQPLDDLINYFTDGTTGQRMDVLSHPDVAAMRLPIYRKALARHGLTLDGGARRVAIAFVCSQSFSYTYVSLSAFLGGAAVVKINLHPNDWRDPDDRVRFLEECDPELVTGDPLAFRDLAALPLRIRPKALISSALTLLPAVRAELQARFGCPVIDVYSTTETGPIAMATERGLEILPHDLLVEILRGDGSLAAAGERGEIAVTVGRNPFLPLIRYRTGDTGALVFDGDVPVIRDFDGRAPVVFRAADGKPVNSIEVTQVMRRFPLTRYAVHQSAGGALEVRTSGAPFETSELETMLRGLFGDVAMTFHELPRDGRKVIPYTVDPPNF